MAVKQNEKAKVQVLPAPIEFECKSVEVQDGADLAPHCEGGWEPFGVVRAVRIDYVWVYLKRWREP